MAEDGIDGHPEESESSTMESLDYEIIENLAYREEQVLNHTQNSCIFLWPYSVWIPS
jgi:hypothetical protein